MNSNGQEGIPNFDTPEKSTNECGSGSGGSIQLHSLSRLNGTGKITANGGDSFGDGGSGNSYLYIY